MTVVEKQVNKSSAKHTGTSQRDVIHAKPPKQDQLHLSCVCSACAVSHDYWKACTVQEYSAVTDTKRAGQWCNRQWTIRTIASSGQPSLNIGRAIPRSQITHCVIRVTKNAEMRKLPRISYAVPTRANTWMTTGKNEHART